MSIRHCIAGVVLVVIGGLAVNAHQAVPVRRTDARIRRTSATDEQILNALQSATVCDFTETPLVDVLQYFKDRHEIEIQLDKGVLDIGPVTRSLKDVSLQSALSQILDQPDLTYIIRNGVLFITTKTPAQKQDQADDILKQAEHLEQMARDNEAARKKEIDDLHSFVTKASTRWQGMTDDTDEARAKRNELEKYIKAAKSRLLKIESSRPHIVVDQPQPAPNELQVQNLANQLAGANQQIRAMERQLARTPAGGITTETPTKESVRQLWEYRTTGSDSSNLKMLGDAGWEMCGVASASGSKDVTVFFKRPKLTEPKVTTTPANVKDAAKDVPATNP